MSSRLRDCAREICKPRSGVKSSGPCMSCTQNTPVIAHRRISFQLMKVQYPLIALNLTRSLCTLWSCTGQSRSSAFGLPTHSLLRFSGLLRFLVRDACSGCAQHSSGKSAPPKPPPAPSHLVVACVGNIPVRRRSIAFEQEVDEGPDLWRKMSVGWVHGVYPGIQRRGRR